MVDFSIFFIFFLKSSVSKRFLTKKGGTTLMLIVFQTLQHQESLSRF